jgi:hypothetical protein
MVSYEDLTNKLSSIITQTANEITLAVTNIYDNLENNYYTKSITDARITVRENSILSTVSENYETKLNAITKYTNLNSSVEQTATSITQIVTAQYSGPPTFTTTQPTASSGHNKTQLYYYNGDYYYWDGSRWADTDNANFGTVFRQTATGFELRGEVSISGDVKISGNSITSGIITGTALQSVDNYTNFRVHIDSGKIRFYNTPYPNDWNQVGGLHYHNAGLGTLEENHDRVFLYTSNGVALKIISDHNMSITTTPPYKTFVEGEVQFGGGNIRFNNGLDFRNLQYIEGAARFKQLLGI